MKTPFDATEHARGDKEQGAIRERFSMAALDASGTEPRWNLIIPVGQYHGPTLAAVGGDFTFTPEFFASMVENWRANGAFRIPIRWGHEHEQNEDPAKAKELDRKAGNVTDLRVTAAGLEGLTAWNDAGRKDVAAGEFDGWSAEFRMRHLNRLTGAVGGPLLSGVALTNRPFFNLMPPVAATAIAESTDNPNKEHDMSLVRIAAALGLSATATEAEIVTAAEKKNPPPAITTETVTAAVSAAVEPMKAQLKAAQDESAKLSAALLERDVDSLLARMKSGDAKAGRAIVEASLKPVVLSLIASAKTQAEGLKFAEDFIVANIPCTVTKTVAGVVGKDEGVITAASANEKLTIIANELAAKGTASPMEAAMAAHPELAQAARSLTLPTKN